MNKLQTIREACIKANPKIIVFVGKDGDFEYLPIILEDVLMAMKALKKLSPSPYADLAAIYWKLGKPLTEQSEETIDFIHKLLT